MVSVREAAVRLGIARPRAYMYVKEGRLPSTRLNGQSWVPVEAIEERLSRKAALSGADCISTAEVAEFFGVHIRTVTGWHAKGLIPARKVNRLLCFDPEVVVAFTPPTVGNVGRNPSRQPTRTLRGVHYPAP